MWHGHTAKVAKLQNGVQTCLSVNTQCGRHSSVRWPWLIFPYQCSGWKNSHHIIYPSQAFKVMPYKVTQGITCFSFMIHVALLRVTRVSTVRGLRAQYKNLFNHKLLVNVCRPLQYTTSRQRSNLFGCYKKIVTGHFTQLSSACPELISLENKTSQLISFY